jgi:hypothetical protein
MNNKLDTPMVTTAPYQVLAGDTVGDRDRALQVWRDAGITAGLDQDVVRYDWFYLKNPAAMAQVNFLTTASAEQPIGFLGVGPRNFLINNDQYTAGVLVDFVVDPKHRTAMPALMLQRTGQARALQSMVLLYGIPDTKAVAIMKRLGSHVCFDLPSYTRVLRTRTYLQRHVPLWCAAPLALCADTVDRLVTRSRLLFSSVVGEWLDDFDARFDRLWEAMPKKNLCVGVRNREFLRWRFGGQAHRRFRIFAVKALGSTELCSYFVCEYSQGAMFVKDCLHVGSARQLQAGLLLLCSAARCLGATSVSLQVTPIDDFPRALATTFFRQRSKRMFVAIVNESVRERCVAARWYVTQADEDV